MFLSGTGDVVALAAGPAASEATVGLLVRMRAAVVLSSMTAQSSGQAAVYSGTANLDQEKALGYLATAVLGAGLLSSGNAARTVGEVVRAKADGAKGARNNPGLLITEPKRAALQAARDAKKEGLGEVVAHTSVAAAREAVHTASRERVVAAAARVHPTGSRRSAAAESQGLFVLEGA